MKMLAAALALALAPVALYAEDTAKDTPKDNSGMCCGSKAMGMGNGMEGKGMEGNGHRGMMGLMTDQERNEHMDKMHSMKDRDECIAYMGEHRKLIQERAQAKGMKTPDMKGDRAMCMKMARASASPK
jgi:hypothetical protein